VAKAGAREIAKQLREYAQRTALRGGIHTAQKLIRARLTA